MLTGYHCSIVSKVGRVSPARRGMPAATLALLLLFLMGCGNSILPATLAAVLPARRGEVGMGTGLFDRTKNHSDEDGPLYRGNFATPPAAVPDEWVVVSYNLRYGEAITETIAAFQTVDPLPAADVVLMQEMHESGVSAVAQALGYNYVYYPASVAARGDNFGNAILARWPIDDPNKIILPGLHPLTGQQRTATQATVRIGGQEVLVYSIHAETATAPRSLRRAQFEAIVASIPPTAQRVIIGGDFNIVTGRGVNQLAKLYDAGGLDHASAALGPTFTRFGLRPSATDHIFYRGFARQAAGVLGHITASDHFPVWARLSVGR